MNHTHRAYNKDEPKYSYHSTYNEQTYNGQTYNIKPKKKKGWIIAIILLVVALIAISVIRVIVSVVNDSFDVDDFDNVNKICKDVFGAELDLTELNGHYGTADANYGVVCVGQAVGKTKNVKYTIQWIEFDSDTSAKTYFSVLDGKYDEQHENESGLIGNSGRVTTMNKIDWYYTHREKSNTKFRKFVAKNGKYMVVLELEGEEDQVDKLYKKFKKKL